MPHDAHPMGVLVSAMSALSVFHPDANPALRVSDFFNPTCVDFPFLFLFQISVVDVGMLQMYKTHLCIFLWLIIVIFTCKATCITCENG